MAIHILNSKVQEQEHGEDSMRFNGGGCHRSLELFPQKKVKLTNRGALRDEPKCTEQQAA